MPHVIDWSGIRAAAVLIGVRAAARQAASHLPPAEQTKFVNRVMQRSHRQHWMSEKAAAIATEKAKSAQVSDGPETAATALADEAINTKFLLSRATKRGARQLANAKTDAYIVNRAAELKAITQTAAILHGWNGDKPTSGFTLNVGLVIGGMEST